MITSRCPSCGAPLVFQHAAIASAVCESCRTTVLRDGPELRALGKVSSMARDLSPIQLGARGEFGGASFQVVGVLRKARERVRWNEWFLLFDDSDTGWLGEGNGEFSLFKGGALEWPHGKPKLNRAVAIAGKSWVPTEVASASIVAADGNLPEPVIQNQRFDYADLRTADGRAFGTVDYTDDPVRFYVGRPVQLSALGLTGLRHFAGWSDPVMVDFQGPEITAVRALTCSSCGAPISVRSPGDTVSVGCGHCGSALGVSDPGDGTGVALSVLAKGKGALKWKPTVLLGARGTLDKIEWEVIGAMRRFVKVDGVRYFWTEHFLHNPYRGYAWLIRDGGSGHWNFVRRISEVPEGARLGSWDPVSWRSEVFKHFQSGKANVEAVLGEFTWEVRAGDASGTVDYVNPPLMLSVERDKGEQTWTMGRWMSFDEVEAAFDAPIGRRPEGVAPNQPNPYDTMSSTVLTRTAALLAAVVLLWVVNAVMWQPAPKLNQAWTTSNELTTEVWVSDPFAVESRGGLFVELNSDVARGDGVVHVALINTTSGAVYLPPLVSYTRNSGDAWVRQPEKGEYVARVEVAKAAGKEAYTDGKLTRLKVVHGKSWSAPFIWTGLFIALAPLFLTFARGRFEHARWQSSDHAI